VFTQSFSIQNLLTILKGKFLREKILKGKICKGIFVTVCDFEVGVGAAVVFIEVDL
jgi:hypothetical protein